jgi:adenine-specific DNA-methyltransferase
MQRVPVWVADGAELYLTPGNHSRLIRAVVEEFAPRFTPGGKLLYVGDTGEKWAHFDPVSLSALGVNVDEHGKMPDVVILYKARDWLVLV